MPGEFNERAVFLAALDLPEADRDAFLRGACPDEATLVRVRALLASHTAGFGSPASETTAASTGRAAGAEGLFIGRFRIEREIGRGGMGMVYLARDQELDRPVAMKVLGPELISSPAAVESLHQEAKLAAGLTHPGIVPVYQFGLADGHSYIVSALVDGPTLREIITAEAAARTRGEGGPRRAWLEHCAETIASVAETLAYCHRQHVIHRDVKPSNILMDPEYGPRLTDFGIAISEVGPAPGALEGSCHYMSPEQASLRSVRVDARSDVFSLGVVLFEMLVLRRPFEGDTSDRVLRSIRELPEPKLRSLDSSLPRDLVTICHKCLEKDPGTRYQSAAHVAADLRSWLAGEPILAVAPSRARRALRWARRWRHAVVLGAAVALSAAAVVEALAWQRHKAMGRIVIPAAMAGYRVRAERLDGTPVDEGIRTPVFVDKGAPLSAYVEPGLYLIVFTGSDGKRLEALSLLTPGFEDVVVMHAPSRAYLATLVKVEAGAHTLGLADAQDEGFTLRRVSLGVFRIGAVEVSNKEYRAFILEMAAAGQAAPGAAEVWRTPYDPADDSLPVAGISWDQANAYCRWRGVRVPTADEWEAAARWPDGRRYPWGDEVHPGLFRSDSREIDGYRTAVRQVSSDPEPASQLGLLHLNSNVAEFVATIAPARNNGVVLKGRSYREDVDTPLSDRMTLSGRQLWGPNLGFRVLYKE